MFTPNLIMPLLAGIAGCNAAVMKQPRVSGGSQSLLVTEKPGHSRDFVRDWLAAHRKWGSEVDQVMVSALSLAQSRGGAESDVGVDVEPLGSDDVYVTDVEVGNPPQVIRLALDTGSADLWMQSTDTVYVVNTDGPWAPRYYPNASRTSTSLKDSKWNVQYVDGNTASGIVYLDTVRLGGIDISNASVQSAQSVAPRFERDTALSGVMGLAKSLPSTARPTVPTLLDLVRGRLDDPVFTADLRRNATGRFDFGRVDESIPTGPLTWLPTDPASPYWEVEFDLTAWHGRQSSWYHIPFRAIVDTGTALLFLPDALAGLYWYEIPGMRVDPRLGNAYTFPCDLADNLPDLLFKLPGSGDVITVPGAYLDYGPVEGEAGDGGRYCWGGMQGAGGLNVSILGDVMLKALFVAFDLEEGKVGFASKRLDDVE